MKAGQTLEQMGEKVLEQKKKEASALLSEEEFKEELDKMALKARHLENIGQFYKSPSRAIRRGNATMYGDVCPKRPFNNKKNSCKRKGKHSSQLNFDKKNIYNSVKSFMIKSNVNQDLVTNDNTDNGGE